MDFNVIKVLLPFVLSFGLGILITPWISDWLYQNKMWKKKGGNKKSSTGKGGTPIFNKLHKHKEVNTPRMGGLVIVGALFLTVLILFMGALLSGPQSWFDKLSFLSRGQTWIPLASFLLGSLLGFVDDYMTVRQNKKRFYDGLPFRYRMLFVAGLGLAIATWFYFKLDMSAVHLPFAGDISLGWLFIPFFVFVMVSVWSSGVIDGIDGLSGGIFSIIFATYAVIAFSQNQYDLAAFSSAVAGSTLAFLWFNIPPARFYMTETGIVGLTLALTTVAFLTNQVLVLPLIALPLVLTIGSVVLQLLSKKFRHGKKIFLVAPVHHHFEAIGWPGYKVTMHYWVVSAVSAVAGLIVALLG